MYEYIENFRELGFGMFVHFGLFSTYGHGEWYFDHANRHEGMTMEEYARARDRFRVKAGWARSLVRAAKSAGCRYITLTTRHHEGFSLYDTQGLSDFDAPHSAAGRDLIREFVDACREGGIVPFFYHTLIDWHHPDFKDNFPKYIDYLVSSVELLCKNYGKIGGLWFDGVWDDPDADWQLDRLYSMIRKYQPEAMIINNTGTQSLGVAGHREIDAVTFERGKPFAPKENGGKVIAGEMCEVLNDHWGYAADDIDYKPIAALVEELVECRACGCNFLLNIGPRGDGSVSPIDAAYLSEIGRWVKANKKFIYSARPYRDAKADGAYLLTDGKNVYAAIPGVPMRTNIGAENYPAEHPVTFSRRITSARWLDSGERATFSGNVLTPAGFPYGTSLTMRVAKVKLK